MNPLVGSHWVSPKQGKMSLEWWAPVRDSSSEPCAREATQKRSRRITSTWASAAVWLIDSSRFPLNMKYDQEEKLREAPTAEPVCTRHCCWGFSRSPASSLCVVCRETQPWCQWEQRLVTLEGVCTKYIASGKPWERTQHFQKIHLQLDCLLWQFTLVNPLFLLVLETTLSVSFLRQRKWGKYFPFKVTNIIVEKKITHLSKKAFCWKQELLHNLIW